MSAQSQIVAVLQLRSMPVRTLSARLSIPAPQVAAEVAALEQAGRVTMVGGYVALKERIPERPRLTPAQQRQQEREKQLTSRLQRDMLKIIKANPDITVAQIASRLSVARSGCLSALEELTATGCVRVFGGHLRAVEEASALAAFESPATSELTPERLLKRVEKVVVEELEGMRIGDVAASLSIPGRDARDALAELLNQGRVHCDGGIYYAPGRLRAVREVQQRDRMDALLGALGVR